MRTKGQCTEGGAKCYNHFVYRTFSCQSNLATRLEGNLLSCRGLSGARRLKAFMDPAEFMMKREHCPYVSAPFKHVMSNTHPRHQIKIENC